MAYLEISKDKAVVHSPLGEEPMSIGRQPGNSIVINDPDISRRHCVIERWEGRYQISDLNSRNGTVVNGKRVQRLELKDGDLITLGGAVARFIEGPMKQRARKRNVLIWGPALMIFLASAFIVAWATGLLGDAPSSRELRQRLGIESSQTKPAAPAASVPDAAMGNAQAVDDDERVRPDEPPIEQTARRDEASVAESTTNAPLVEPVSDRLRYQRLDGPNATADADRLLGRPVAARFVGRPTRDAAGELIWELPPDGEIAAVLIAADDERRRVLEVMEAEPLLLEVELAGVLRRDRDGTRLVLQVGVVEILRAWGEQDSALQPATRELLGKRMVIDPRATAASVSPGEI